MVFPNIFHNKNMKSKKLIDKTISYLSFIYRASHKDLSIQNLTSTLKMEITPTYHSIDRSTNQHDNGPTDMRDHRKLHTFNRKPIGQEI